jgi:hypothetical protein
MLGVIFLNSSGIFEILGGEFVFRMEGFQVIQYLHHQVMFIV